MDKVREDEIWKIARDAKLPDLYVFKLFLIIFKSRGRKRPGPGMYFVKTKK